MRIYENIGFCLRRAALYPAELRVPWAVGAAVGSVGVIADWAGGGNWKLGGVQPCLDIGCSGQDRVNYHPAISF